MLRCVPCAFGALGISLLALGCSETSVVQPVTPGNAPIGEWSAGWRQWGGPDGNFRVRSADLATGWPPEGPPVVWSRELGEGYSAIAADARTLFTMYRDGDEDVVVALRASDGETVWEHRYEAPALEGNNTEFGVGPNATPLVLDDRLVTLGYAGALRCLDRDSGEVLWSHRLVEDFEAEALMFGYSASPILHQGKVVVLVGGERYGAVAFEAGDGSIAWSGPASSVSYATPSVIDVDGQAQLLYFSADELIAVHPGDGSKLWSFPVENQYRNNATGTHWNGDLLWVATQLDGGTRALRLATIGGESRVEEVWSSNKLSVHYWNTLLLGEHVYASIGSNATVLAGIDLRSGEVVWRERGFEKVNLIQAGNVSILFDAKGHLALAELSPSGMTIRSQARILEGPTWTAPTLVGSELYIRDKQSILRLDLGVSSAGGTAAAAGSP